MINYLYAYLIALSTMTLLDTVWLGFIAPGFYKKHIGFIMAKNPNLIAAIIFYLIFVLGVTTFVIYPSWKNFQSLTKTGILGALFGLVTYATYDLTNQASLNNWPYIVTFVDLLWGTVLIALVSIIAVSLLKRLFKEI